MLIKGNSVQVDPINTIDHSHRIRYIIEYIRMHTSMGWIRSHAWQLGSFLFASLSTESLTLDGITNFQATLKHQQLYI